MTNLMRWGSMGAVLVAVLASSGAAQGRSLSDQVNGVRDGDVRFTFAAREGVCPNDGEGWHVRGQRRGEWESGCSRQPVRVALTRSGGAVVDLRSYVGGAWLPEEVRTTDLGVVPAAEAARYLVSVGATAPQRAAERAIAASTIADSADVWRQLLSIARDSSRPRSVQRTATFWVSMQAGDRVTEGLAELVASDSLDLEVREHAVFALSRRPRDEGIPELISIVRSSSHPRIRQRALFWLGQSGDDRALALFEELLGGGRR